MKLRFFESKEKSFILDDETASAAALPWPGVFEEEDAPTEYYQEKWSGFMTEPLGDYLRDRGLSMEDFTEVDSYGKPLQDAA